MLLTRFRCYSQISKFGLGFGIKNYVYLKIQKSNFGLKFQNPKDGLKFQNLVIGLKFQNFNDDLKFSKFGLCFQILIFRFWFWSQISQSKWRFHIFKIWISNFKIRFLQIFCHLNSLWILVLRDIFLFSFSAFFEPDTINSSWPKWISFDFCEDQIAVLKLRFSVHSKTFKKKSMYFFCFFSLQ